MSENPESKVLLIQFAKWPELGRVKTRLTPALGEQGALAAHQRLTLAVLDNLLVTGLPVQFWWDRPLTEPPASALPVLEEIHSGGAVQRFQRGTDLGARMQQALATGLEDHHKVLIIGSDCPAVEAGYVAEAVAALDQADVVIGPSDDGGYVLIGARRTTAGMLDGIAWGSPQVLEQTCEKLIEEGLSHRLLEPRWDVDEPGDWERFIRLSGDHEAAQ
ncbi:MAG: TIGR04282 family arsenosugar biosynthesis glycosyltransferase [Marinobacter sp.]|uniref:TIGR04282 family arsenosugar biosynthesis glycosyltransferase n=1 Tax=Marinobacter sp. TaxID=50741 RepID=UPI0034A08998